MTTYGDLRTYARDNYADAVDTKATRLQERIVIQAVRRVARGFEWSFYNQIGRINLYGEFRDGTVSIPNGSNVVTLNGGPNWPADAARRDLIIEGNADVEFEVATRDSGVQLTFLTDHIWLPATLAPPGNAYTAYLYRYQLPTNFRKFYFGESEEFWDLDYLTPRDFAELRLRASESSGDPRFYTIWQKREFHVWPWPSDDRALDFNYVRWPTVPTNTPWSAPDALIDVDWDEDMMDLMYSAIDVEIIRSWGQTAPNQIITMEQRYQQYLRECKIVDSERSFNRGHTWSHSYRRIAPEARWRREVPP